MSTSNATSRRLLRIDLADFLGAERVSPCYRKRLRLMDRMRSQRIERRLLLPRRNSKTRKLDC